MKSRNSVTQGSTTTKKVQKMENQWNNNIVQSFATQYCQLSSLLERRKILSNILAYDFTSAFLREEIGIPITDYELTKVNTLTIQYGRGLKNFAAWPITKVVRTYKIDAVLIALQFASSAEQMQHTYSLRGALC